MYLPDRANFLKRVDFIEKFLMDSKNRQMMPGIEQTLFGREACKCGPRARLKGPAKT